MASTTTGRLYDLATQVPSLGTVPSAANQLFPRGTIVTINSSGNAVSPSSADASGFMALGVARHTQDNRTGSDAGGSAGDLDIQLGFGVFGFAYEDTPKAGDLMFVVDNQTVSPDSDSEARGYAGVCVEVRDGKAWVWMGPHTKAHANAIDLSVAEDAIADHAADLAEGEVVFPIGLAPAFANGTVNGLDPSVMGFRLNNAVDDQPFACAVALPDDFDGSEDVIVKVRAYIIDDATDDDVVMVLVAKFDGGSDVAPVSVTILGESAATISFTIPAASVPDAAKSLYVEIDCAATLDTSDAVIESAKATFTKAIASA